MLLDAFFLSREPSLLYLQESQNGPIVPSISRPDHTRSSVVRGRSKDRLRTSIVIADLAMLLRWRHTRWYPLLGQHDAVVQLYPGKGLRALSNTQRHFWYRWLLAMFGGVEKCPREVNELSGCSLTFCFQGRSAKTVRISTLIGGVRRDLARAVAELMLWPSIVGYAA